MTTKIARNLQAFRIAVKAHDELNPPPHGPAYGIGLSCFDMERLGFEDGETLWGGVTIHADGGQAGMCRVLCSGEHAGEGERVEATVRDAAGVGT
jgi:hypothetical protein